MPSFCVITINADGRHNDGGETLVVCVLMTRQLTAVRLQYLPMPAFNRVTTAREISCPRERINYTT